MFPQLIPNSKVWIYQANRELTENEVSGLLAELKDFISSWAAHGDQLLGDVKVHANRFVIVAVDESHTNVSGCSIDTSVRKVKELGEKLDIDFFNRMNVYIEKDNEYKYVHVADLKDFIDWELYNPMISNLEQLRTSWKIPVSTSPFV